MFAALEDWLEVDPLDPLFGKDVEEDVPEFAAELDKEVKAAVGLPPEELLVRGDEPVLVV